jgi:hypothetical protein
LAIALGLKIKRHLELMEVIEIAKNIAPNFLKEGN